MKTLSHLKKAVLVCAVLVSGSVASANYVDLTSVGAEGWLNSAFYLQIDPDSSMGTGVIDAFLGIQGKNTKDPTVIEKGYNTDGKLEFDELGGTHTRAILLSDVPEVSFRGGIYREFVLDVNEDISGDGRFITLEDLKLYITSDADITGYPANFSSPVYSMDTETEDNYVLLNAALDTGSGGGDMLVLIPSSLFGLDETKYVNLYSEFSNYDSGFEEWAVGKGGALIPEPGTLALIAFGGLISFFRRNRK